MKKNLFTLTVLALMVFNCSTENNPNTANKESLLNGYQISSRISTSKVISKIANEYFVVSNQKNNFLNNVYEVNDEKLSKNYILASFEEDLKLTSSYNIKSALVYYSMKHLVKDTSFTFIIRTIENKNGESIFEVVSAVTGEIIYYNLNNIDESKYLDFRKKYYNENLKTDANNSTPNVVCFENFNACFNHMNGNENNPTDQVVCELLPCNTFAYVGCVILGEEGYIQDNGCFRGCQACDVFIDDKN